MVKRTQVKKIARAIVPVAHKHRLDPTLLAAIAIAESGGRNLVAYRRGRRRQGADVGVFQIHCPRSRLQCIRRYRNVYRSAAEAAQILVLGRQLCKAPRPAYLNMCRRGFWARYNPGSRRWAKRVRAIWTRIRVHMQLPTGV